jgi:ABC-type transporter Mla subunit MlaD
MTKREQQQVTRLLATIQAKTVKVAKLRDELRAIHEDLEGIIDSLNTGVADIEDGARQIESGIDTLSQYV